MTLNIERVNELLACIKKVNIAVYGDFCLDAYWIMGAHGSEVSVETGLQAHAVAKHYYTLGGASNIVANLAALKPSRIQVIGVVGDDIFGRELARQLKDLGVDTTRLVVQQENFDTVTFCKRYLQGNEQARIDVGFFNQHTEATDEMLLKGLRDALETADVVIFNQQVPGSITHDSFIHNVNALFDEFSHKIVLLDSRHYGSRFKNVYRKINDCEAAHLNGMDVSPDDVFTLSDVKRFADHLFQQSRKPIFVTRGSRGMLVCDAEGAHEVPGIQFLKKTDPVGAGDTTLSALACCLAVDINPVEAAEFANFAAGVTVQKLFQTGTASGEEILELAKDADYLYQPELAEDIRQASYFKASEIEFCCEFESISCGRITHAVFDHDGTLSTLRQGWEAVMEGVMMRAVLGTSYDTADETLYHRVHKRVCEYINKSTGIQTILQMEALEEIVKEFGIVPSDEVLDTSGYKGIYNKALMKMVNQRISKLKRGELDVNDFTIKGAPSFIKSLRDKGVMLYLASGTDRDDVIAEAKALGYADLFNGGIYGALGDISRYSKKIVIESILRDNHLQGRELACFGDGPVEMRECRKHDGISIGIASDEIRRHGLNKEKRTRLIKGGAHIIVSDFSQAEKLLALLFRHAPG